MMYGYFHNIRQDMSIGRATAKAESASQKAADIQIMLESKIDKLSLIIQALWSFIRQHHSITEEQLMEKVKEIDLRDGVLDGKVQKGRAKECPGCKRIMNRMHNKCLYCGEGGLADTAFETL